MVLFIGWSLLEGIGSALMGPALISIITGTYDGIYRTKALAVVSTMAGVAVAIGPLFGGVVTTFFSWRFGFGFELIVVAFVLLQYRKIKVFPRIASRKDLDITGAVLSVAGLLLLMTGILQLADKNVKLCVILVTAGIMGVVLTLGAVSGLREAINTYTPVNLSYEAFRANAEMYMQKMGNVDPLTITVKNQAAYQKIVNAIYQDSMGMVMMVAAGLMALGIILALSLKDIK